VKVFHEVPKARHPWVEGLKAFSHVLAASVQYVQQAHDGDRPWEHEGIKIDFGHPNLFKLKQFRALHGLILASEIGWVDKMVNKFAYEVVSFYFPP
jgi:hypothetical protein